MSGQILPNWLAQRAASAPDLLALQFEAQRWSYADLDAWASTLARQLAAAGAQPGERVALLLRNQPAFVALFHAAPRLGVTLVPLNTRLAAPELAWQIEDVGAQTLVFDEENAALAADALAALARPPRALSMAKLTSLPAAEIALQPTIDLDAIFTIIYTSGTTGRPKGAMLSYGNYWWSAIGSALNLGTHANDRWLAVLPLFHVGGLSIALRAVIYGIPMLLHASFDAARVHAAIDADGVTIVSVVSTMVQRMLDARGGAPYPPTLRCLLLGGGPAPQPLLEACVARGLPVAQTYGMTETTSQAATLAPADALRKLGSAGQPLLPSELRIVRDGVDAPPGVVGEIVVRGPTVLRGYVNRPDATAAALRDGWLYTGDLGYRDDEGFLFVVSRRTDLIISGGENVSPAEIEAALLAHPAVAEAAALGLPDAQWGQVPAAAVVLRAGQTPAPAELIAFCRARLAGYKTPRRIEIVPALPRNAGGKVVRAELRALFEA